jgi:hypothetical protein
MQSSEYYSSFVFVSFLVVVLAQRLAILTVDFCAFSQSLQG